MQLKEGTSLQGGRYRIEKFLGQGGFGITYLGVQVGLNRRVAIKEFFMKEYCNREEETSRVTVPSMGSKDLVERFRQKFVKEAQTIAGLNHPHIIRIHDVFEEHGTAYYVMEYHSGGSLKELVDQRGRLDESDSLRHIRQIADALGYIHEHHMNHLDIKPGNVLLDDMGNAVLIDFGMSKRYAADGEQTSTTPVGISHGYAPMEQYKKGGVGTFSPATDIYSLGATFYKLLTGVTPPDASDVDEDGLPPFPASVSASSKTAIQQAMKPKRKDRPQSVAAFLSLLDASFEVSGEDDNEDTVLDDVVPLTPVPKPKPFSWKWLISLVLFLAIVLGGVLGISKGSGTISSPSDTINGYAYVDLGLSVKWATMNVGASSPGDYGDYFAWGEVHPKSEYTDKNSLTYEKEMGEISGNSKYDAACYHWGSSWRLPTKKELEELKDKCRWSWTQQDGHEGYKVVGPNGNSIFLPAAGLRAGTSTSYVGTFGYYWSGSPHESDTQDAYYLNFDADYRYVYWDSRYYGQSVRPVSE